MLKYGLVTFQVFSEDVRFCGVFPDGAMLMR